MSDTFFFPQKTTGEEAIKNLFNVFEHKKFDEDFLLKKLNFLEPWKDGQNIPLKMAKVTHFNFPVDLGLAFLYQSENYFKTLAINIDHCNAKFLFLKEKNNELEYDLLGIQMSDFNTIFLGDERKDFLPPSFGEYNKPNKTTVEVYDHINKKIVASFVIDDVFLPDSPFQTNLVINKDHDEIHVFVFGEMKYDYAFYQIVENNEEKSKDLYI